MSDLKTTSANSSANTKSMFSLNLTRKHILVFTLFSSLTYILFTLSQTDQIVIEPVERNKTTKIKILLWLPLEDCFDCAPFGVFKYGNKLFQDQNCSYQNCYIVPNRKNLCDVNDTKEYRAILFNGRIIRRLEKKCLPKTRYAYQKFIFVNLESSDRFPVCQEYFDDYFNWTMTYRIDSDIPWTYFKISDMNNQTIGPQNDIQWMKDMLPIEEELKAKVEGKTKLGAWFVSNCHGPSGRLQFMTKLNKELERLQTQTVDVFGRCGTHSCLRNESEKCYQLLEKDYLFYFAMENSFAKDYVTEKLLTALQHNTIPVVYGSANYSQFLPPGSYLDAFVLGPKKLASTMMELFNNRTMCNDYFKWQKHYRYYDTMRKANACTLCKKLNRQSRVTRYMNFRSWWSKNYKKQCRKIKP